MQQKLVAITYTHIKKMFHKDRVDNETIKTIWINIPETVEFPVHISPPIAYGSIVQTKTAKNKIMCNRKK